MVGNPLQVDAPITVAVAGTPDPDDSIIDAFAACGANCSEISRKLAAFFPTNTGTSTALNMDLNNQNREDNGIAKLDYHFSERNSFVGTYFIGDSEQIEEDTTVLNPLFLSHAR